MFDNSFWNVKAEVSSRPCENRFVAFIWRESYQVLPSGANRVLIPENCGNGRRLWATVLEVGKLAYGTLLNPRLAAAAESSREVSRVRSAALLMSRPNVCRRAGVSAFRSISPLASNQAPRLPT